MKYIIRSLVLMSVIQVSSCNEALDKTYEFHVEVVDEAGNPIQDANIQASKDVLVAGSPIPISDTVRVEVPTDKKGIATIVFDAVHSPGGVAVKKDGYYLTTAIANWNFLDGDNVRKKAKTEIKATLKPVKNPIPMYAYSNMGSMEKMVKIPEIEKWYGFDLMKSEALPPLGKGNHADFSFMVKNENSSNPDDLTLEIKFNSNNDGVIEFMTPQRQGKREPVMYGSQFISDYSAPENGYISTLRRNVKWLDGGKTVTSDDDFRKNYYFRTRTKIAPNGHIISANYGKIYGDFYFSAARKEWGYIASFALIETFFNPTPNDRNVEFDPKRNLNPEGNVQKP